MEKRIESYISLFGKSKGIVTFNCKNEGLFGMVGNSDCSKGKSHLID